MTSCTEGCEDACAVAGRTGGSSRNLWIEDYCNTNLRKKKNRSHFSVSNEIVLYDNIPIAKYQAKTYSLDGGELVEEYNLLLIDNKITNKQLIGDLIDFVSDRHEGAEVEVEIDAKGSIFNL